MRKFFTIVGLLIVVIIVFHFMGKINFGNTTFGNSVIQGTIK